GAVEVIRGVDLRIDPGEFVVFVGPSCCGKSTLLRLISGLEYLSGGELALSRPFFGVVFFRTVFFDAFKRYTAHERKFLIPSRLIAQN
ncbi:ATP-binding cassette domain-containing protein, partial [Rhizobium leguminosarum]|uniref:ATP-binding cassette domain-containing protein n=1 Tax=Rhizobium leguminosarum TaxID=384 RepID=UPI003F9550CB